MPTCSARQAARTAQLTTRACGDTAGPGSPTPAGDEAETRFTLAVPVDKVGKGNQICLQTTDGHLALVEIQGFSGGSSPSDHLSLDLTVWRGALDQ